MSTPVAEQKFRQILVSDRESQRLKDRIWSDFTGAKSNHDLRIQKLRRLWRMWRGLSVTTGSREDGPNFEVPMIKWVTFGQWARIMQALIGEDAEVIAEPRSREGDKAAAKVGQYMTWRFFDYMRALAQLSPFVFRSILFGRGHAEILYEQEYYFERDAQTGKDKEVLAYDGPKLRALWPSELILPAQDNISHVTEFHWKIRRLRLTPEQLRDGERRGKYQGIRENWRAIASEASQRQERDFWWDDERIDADEAEGVDHAALLGNRDSVEVWRWYGSWRLPRGKRDSLPDNLDYREDAESELLVTFLPRPGLVIGIQDRRDLYPRMRKRDPFVDMAMVKDGTYWPPGLGELLEDIQNEATINHALFRKAGQLSVGPIIFFKPGGGFDPEEFEYKPGRAIPTEDPTSVNAVALKADLSYSEAMQGVLKTYAELTTGVSDQTLGAAIDRPNAPRTASGQAMLIQEGNTRASLDMTMVRDDLGMALEYVWDLDREYADDEVFFRVTGEDAGGLFDVESGFGVMTAEEREHSYSFDLKFATSVYSREAKKQAILQLYQISMANPILMQNPRAMWVLLNRAWEAFGEKNFRDVIPEPPETDRPKSPKEEWAEMLDREDIHVNPLDDDIAHITDHRNRLQKLVSEPKERRDPEMEKRAVAHILEHEMQRRQKMVLQETITAATNAIQSQMGQPQPGAPGGQPPQMQPPSPNGPPIAPNVGQGGAPGAPPVMPSMNPVGS